MIDHSQFGEYKNFLASYPWGKSRFLVDVGACSSTDSNTYDLLDRHQFRGLLIEPIEYQRVKQEFEVFGDRVIIEPVAVASTPGTQTMYLHTSIGHHSLDPNWLQETKTQETLEVPVVTLPSLLQKHEVEKEFAFLDIDTEGLDAEILHHLLDTSPYRPSVILIEKTHAHRKTQTDFNLLHLLSAFGYVTSYENDFNIAYTR